VEYEGRSGTPVQPRQMTTSDKLLLAAGALVILGALFSAPRRKKIFVSYDYDNDRHYRYLLSAWDANRAFAFSFDDHSTPLINSTNGARIRAAITRRLQGADYLLVIVGQRTHRSKWVAWEIAKAKELGLRLIAVKVVSSYPSPPGLLSAGAVWARSFSADGVARAVAQA
jgi:hypothetical protein